MSISTTNSVELSLPHSKNAAPIQSEMEALDFKQKIHVRESVARENYILRRLGDFKRVLHLGCSDAPFTHSSLAANKLLHTQLLQRNKGVVGFDLSAIGVQALRNAYPDANFVLGNAEQLGLHFPEDSFDLIVAGEILEHLSNPGLFLESCAKVLSPDGVLLITVPNAFGIRRYFHTLFGIENYHPDHTFYFTENTIAHLASRHGLNIYRARYYVSEPGDSWLKRALYACIERFPAFFLGNHFLEGMVLELKKRI